MKRRMMTVALSAIAGCGGDDGATVSRRSACERAARALCDRIVECVPESNYEECLNGVEAEENCAAREGDCPQPQLDECLDDLEALDCDAEEPPTSCADNDC